ncbi:mechanosensitive ion channel family protein [Salinactinospora qingdaonensis]|uniref:Mechanosensitive ion channel MscS domain-containing protein n=1 Tax=Salinactinospora qingdaonensis TaxID=702744 RepID=A0ABP7EXE8_9ACTN
MGMEHLIAIGIAVAIAVLVVSVAHWLLAHKLSKVWQVAPPLVHRCRISAYAAAVVLGVNIAIPDSDGIDYATYGVFRHAMGIAMIASVTWLALTIAYAITDVVLDRLSPYNGDSDLRARRLRTQVRLLRRVVATIIGILATAAILFTFPSVQALGAGLLASAGLIGIVAGVAAQSVLGNLFAGLQLAFSDALRLNDVVVIEGEWGRIEELTLTKVTVRIWDERRLVLPVSHFTTTPFENWTKQNTALTGYVKLYVDWEVPVEQLREVAGAFITNHPLWDGRRWSLQVTDVLQNGLVEVRAVMTTADSDARWDLCCELREHLVGYLATNCPLALPRNRTEISEFGGGNEERYATIWPSSAFRRPVGHPTHTGPHEAG